MAANHQVADAWPLEDPAASTGTTGSYAWSVNTDTALGYGTPIVDPPPGNIGYNSAFWVYTPATDIKLQGTIIGSNAATQIALYSRVSGVWALVAGPVAVGTNFPDGFQADLTENTLYYLVAGNFRDQQSQTITVRALLYGASKALKPPAAPVRVSGRPARITGGVITVSAPASQVRVTSAGTLTPAPIAAPTALVHLSAPVAAVRQITHLEMPAASARLSTHTPLIVSAAITLSSPIGGISVPTSTPTFTVALSSRETTAVYTIELQYAPTDTFAAPTVLTATVPVVEGGTVLTATDPAADTTYWRARLLQDAEPVSGWSSTETFTVDNAVTPAVLALSWTVNAAITAPVHLWHIEPPVPAVGEQVTIYGQAFPTSGRLTFGDTDIPAQSWTLVAASQRAGDDDRVISSDVVDAEHFEVVFIAPAYDGPGAALSVEA